MPAAHRAHHHGHGGAVHPAQAAAIAAKPLWTVVRQELDRRYVPGTDPVELWNVYFVTRSGTEAYVTIPRDQYSAEMAATMIQPEAEIIEAVAALHEAK